MRNGSSLRGNLKVSFLDARNTCGEHNLGASSVKIERSIDRMISRHEFEALEREDEATESSLGSSLGSSLLFEGEILSPYVIPLDGEVYSDHGGFGPTGLCPLCNNAQHEELDKFIVLNIKKPSALADLPFTRGQVARHVACHIGIIYAKAASKAVDTLVNRHAYTLARDTKELSSQVTRALRYATLDKEKAKESAEPDINVLMPVVPVHLEDSLQPAERPHSAEPKKWYAFDGSMQVGPLRPWGDNRMSQEIEKRARDAIVFYDEMLDVRSMAHRIYGEIMDRDGEPILDKHGEVVGYKDKNFGAAIQAVRVIKDTAMDMGKMALIAMKYGEEKGKIQTLSPALQGMLSDMGLFNEERQVNDDMEENQNTGMGLFNEERQVGDEEAQGAGAEAEILDDFAVEPII